MFSPADQATETRMQTATTHVAELLDLMQVDTPVWGWRGRTVGSKVMVGGKPAWLRVQSAVIGKEGGRIWQGTAEAAAVIPARVPKPQLLALHDWQDDGYAYRAELTEYIASPPCSPDPVLRQELDLPHGWWRSLRSSLAAVSQVRTDRITLSQDYLSRALPQYLDAPDIETAPPRWATAHGDCHWANLTQDGPILLDWEGFGQAPAGYDVALLAAHTMLVPTTEQRVRTEFEDILDTPEGRFAELTVLAELLQTVTRGDNLDLGPHLHRRAKQLLTV